MEEPTGTIFEFGPFRLDPRRRRLWNRGNLISLTPKALETLIFLVENSGRTLSKEELMERIWPDTLVEESNLTQTIFVLRKALEESADRPQYILTVPRTGYRFIAKVRAVTDREELSDTLATTRRGRSGATRRLLLPGGLVLVVTAAAVLTLALFSDRSISEWLGIDESDSLLPEKGRTEPVRLALTPFEIKEGEQDGELQLLAISIVDLLSQRLSLIPDLVLFFPKYGDLVADPAFDFYEFAVRSGSKFLLGGRLRRSSDSQKGHLTVTLKELSGEGVGEVIPIGQFDIPFLSESSDVRNFETVRNQIIARLLSEVLPAIELAPDSGFVPRHPEAYRLYLSGLNRLRQASCAGETILAYLSPSLQMDPDFAPAWEAFGWAQYNLASFCGQSAAHYEEALKAADRALALTPNWARAIALKATVLVETGRIEDAYSEIVKAQRSPELRVNSNIEFLEAYVLRYAGYLGEARKKLENVLEREPIFLTAEGWTPNTLLYLGDVENFLRFLPSTDTPLFRYYRGFALSLSEDEVEAIDILKPAFVSNPNDTFARLSEALRAILEDQYSEARLQLQQLALQRSKLNSGDGEVSYKIAQLLVLAGDRDGGLEQLSLAVRQGFCNFPYIQRDPVLEKIRSDPRFQQISEEARQRHLEFGKRFGLGVGLED